MAVKRLARGLEGPTNRYIGLSTDEKPGPAEALAPLDLPPGSSFLEADTGQIWRFDGRTWQHAPREDRVAELLELDRY